MAGKEVKEVLKVRAFRTGFYGLRRRRPDREKHREFILKDRKDFSHLWMEPIGWKPDPFKGPKELLREKHTVERSIVTHPIPDGKAALDSETDPGVPGAPSNLSDMDNLEGLNKDGEEVI